MRKVAIIKTRTTQLLLIVRAPKIAFGQLRHANLGALRKQKYDVEGSIVIGFLLINLFHLFFNHFKEFQAQNVFICSNKVL